MGLILRSIKGKRVICYFCILYIVGILIVDGICGREAFALPDALEGTDEGDVITVVGTVYQIDEKDYGQ